MENLLIGIYGTFAPGEWRCLSASAATPSEQIGIKQDLKGLLDKNERVSIPRRKTRVVSETRPAKAAKVCSGFEHLPSGALWFRGLVTLVTNKYGSSSGSNRAPP